MYDTYKLSLSPNLRFDSSDSDEFEGFRHCEITLEEFEIAIAKGWAFSPQYSENIYKSTHFICSDFLVIDINDGTKIEECIQHPIVQNYCSIWYVCPEHTPDRHHIRLIFCLDQTLTSYTQYIAARRSLIMRLCKDVSFHNRSDVFFGYINGGPEKIGKTIPKEYLENLIDEGDNGKFSESINSAHATLSRSKAFLKREDTFETLTNEQIKCKNIKYKTTVFCPFHFDKVGSAFLNKNSNGIYFYCEKCCVTKWTKDSIPYDFDSFEKAVIRLRTNPSNIPDSESSYLMKYLNIGLLHNFSNIHLSSDRYLQMGAIEEGISFVKSPKGTGKTTYLSNALRDVIFVTPHASLEDLENDDSYSPSPIYTNKKVLLIGHRQALIRDLCNKLSLNCYLENAEASEIYNRQRFGVCIDSIKKVHDEKYDVIIIDEVEQVLAHFLSETLGNRRIEAFQYFSDLLSKAKCIVALDADLSWLSFITLIDTRKVGDKPTPINIYINKPQLPSKPLYLYVTSEQLISHLLESLLSRKRVFVVSNSKKKIKALEKSIEALSQTLPTPIKLIAITSENSNIDSVQKFILNIKSEILNYNAILASPSLGTGIDITFPSDASEIDVVYGLFENRINSHTEIDQQLSRVRNPKQIHVWVSQSTYNFETDFEVIEETFYDDFLASNLLATPKPHDLNQKFSPFIRMCSLIISAQRASKNHLKINFVNHKQNEGWNICPVPHIPDEYKEGRGFYDKGLDALNKEVVKTLLLAPTMTRAAMHDFLNRREDLALVHNDEFKSYYRTQLELFYQQSITEELIKLDNNWQYRNKVLSFEVVTNPTKIKSILSDKRSTVDDKLNQRAKERLLINKSSGNLLTYEILSTTPFFDGKAFNKDITFSKVDLAEFSEIAEKLHTYVQTQLGITTRADIKAKPIMHLNNILDKIGLKVVKHSNKQSAGIKTYYYSLSEKHLITMLDIVNRRAIVGHRDWDFVNNLYGFVEDNTVDY